MGRTKKQYNIVVMFQSIKVVITINSFNLLSQTYLDLIGSYLIWYKLLAETINVINANLNTINNGQSNRNYPVSHVL